MREARSAGARVFAARGQTERAVQAALHQRSTMHVRIARLADDGTWLGA